MGHPMKGSASKIQLSHLPLFTGSTASTENEGKQGSTETLSSIGQQYIMNIMIKTAKRI